ncbi:hypothetical protein ED733_004946 [Metarhizium rileyi]|uniref:COX assembly mitochondrial protein n=1 Tax=Metarhizium rileyi (strain RCEF 4871) TaxID=1649241 RepID=A0A5C6GJS7_METRR|nr:hypothetical protein ED733_004946 [Metarhizium rileyi]
MDQAGEKPTSHVLETPIWLVVIRGLQFLISLIIIGLAGSLMHDLYLDEFGLSAATAILTWCILFYAVCTEKIPAWQAAYHVLAVAVLDGFLVIMWLATFAAVAARRATFKFNVRVNGCVDDGSAIGSKTCYTRRHLESRDILFKSGGNMMSAIAGLGALLWLSFIATFAWTMIMFLRGRKEGRFPVAGVSGGPNNFQMEPKPEQTAPMMQPQQQYQHQQHQHQQQYQHQQQQQYQQPVQPQHTGEHQPSPLSHNPTPTPYQPAQSPYQQQPPYHPPQDGQHYPSHQQNVQQGSELSGTPLPQQPYSSPPAVTTSPPPQQEHHHQHYHQPPQPPHRFEFWKPFKSQTCTNPANDPANLRQPVCAPAHTGSRTNPKAWNRASSVSPEYRPGRGELGEQQAAAAASMAAEKRSVPDQRPGLVPSRNPLPLSASQESQVRDIFYARVRRQCAEEIRAFAACALGRTFTVSFACRAEHRVMNSCMKLRATAEEHDAAREEWFAMRMERHRQRERKAKMAVAQEEFIREWWGLPEEVRASKQRELERLAQGERVGGLTARERPRGPDGSR